MSEFKLDFEQRAEAEKVSEEIAGDPDEYAYELVWSRAEIARLRAENESLWTVVKAPPYGDLVRLAAELKRQQTVVDAAREECREHSTVKLSGLTLPCQCKLCKAVRALDGEPSCPTCKGSGLAESRELEPDADGKRAWVGWGVCPDCGGSGVKP